MNFRKEITVKLNNLLQNNLNSAAVYQQAFDKTENTQLKIFFRYRIKQRKEFAEELRTEVLRYGNIPQDDTSIENKLERNWISFKTLFTSNNEEVVLEKCLESDKKALNDYKELITEKELPPSLDTIFMKHYSEIQNTINKDKLYLETAST